MQINNVMGVTIGPGGYFLNFTEFGLQINAGNINPHDDTSLFWQQPGVLFGSLLRLGLCRCVDSGHEVMMDRCWLGETNFDFDHVQHGVAPNATAIQINGNDHYILVRSNPSLLLSVCPAVVASESEPELRCAVLAGVLARAEHDRVLLQDWPRGQWRRRLYHRRPRVVSRCAQADIGRV